eukprot:TRINITY_DN21203_c0_g1_i2.p1 TRINITY_DN21203_c0_g1~~TRINITY_DN21203_c0_g1_i2.p1  ORF type:complete len:376 (+),score=47.25 TRINITY_DN21203_c0_g1_i2:269-1396(+)
MQTSFACCVGIPQYQRKVRTLRDLALLAAWEVKDWLLVPEDEADMILSHAYGRLAAPMTTALALLQAMPRKEQQALLQMQSEMSSGCELQYFLHGGFRGHFIEIAGPGGVGKTQFSLHLAACAAAVAEGELLWLDTENTFSPERMLRLLEACLMSQTFQRTAAEAADAALEKMRRIRCLRCSTLADIQNVADDLLRDSRAGRPLPSLLVVDSIAAAARKEGMVQEAAGQKYLPQRQAALSALAASFKALIARQNGRAASPEAQAPQRLAIVVTNQVSGGVRDDHWLPHRGPKVALGHVWHHAVGWRFVLAAHSIPSRGGYGHVAYSGRHPQQAVRRYMHIEKSPCMPSSTIQFEIAAGGLSQLATSAGLSLADPP